MTPSLASASALQASPACVVLWYHSDRHGGVLQILAGKRWLEEFQVFQRNILYFVSFSSSAEEYEYLKGDCGGNRGNFKRCIFKLSKAHNAQEPTKS
jgi:hypothetical protein